MTANLRSPVYGAVDMASSLPLIPRFDLDHFPKRRARRPIQGTKPRRIAVDNWKDDALQRWAPRRISRSYDLAALMPSAPSQKPHQDRVAAANLLTRDRGAGGQRSDHRRARAETPLKSGDITRLSSALKNQAVANRVVDLTPKSLR